MTNELRLPDFELWNRKYARSTNGMLFDHHPEFMKKYVLKSYQENAVRQLFQPYIIDAFMLTPGWSAAGWGGWLAIWQRIRYKVFNHEKLGNFLNETVKIAKLFLVKQGG